MPKIDEAARAARRDQIIAAGAACFGRAGYHATTMADVAAEAGVPKGTPYLYVESREALFIALHDAWDCGVAGRASAAVAALPGAARRSPRRILHAVAAAVAAHVLEETGTCRVLMEARALAAHEPAVAAAVRAAGELLSLKRISPRWEGKPSSRVVLQPGALLRQPPGRRSVAGQPPRRLRGHRERCVRAGRASSPTASSNPGRAPAANPGSARRAGHRACRESWKLTGCSGPMTAGPSSRGNAHAPSSQPRKGSTGGSRITPIRRCCHRRSAARRLERQGRPPAGAPPTPVAALRHTGR